MAIEPTVSVDAETHGYLREVDEESERDKISRAGRAAILNIWDLRFNAVNIKKQPSVRPLSSTPIDLAADIAQAISDAKSGNWAGAISDSLDVAHDVIDLSQNAGEAFVKSRIEAVQEDYAGNVDVGFQ